MRFHYPRNFPSPIAPLPEKNLAAKNPKRSQDKQPSTVPGLEMEAKFKGLGSKTGTFLKHRIFQKAFG